MLLFAFRWKRQALTCPHSPPGKWCLPVFVPPSTPHNAHASGMRERERRNKFAYSLLGLGPQWLGITQRKYWYTYDQERQLREMEAQKEFWLLLSPLWSQQIWEDAWSQGQSWQRRWCCGRGTRLGSTCLHRCQWRPPRTLSRSCHVGKVGRAE